MSTDWAIQTFGLAKSYRDKQVLAGVDLQVHRGSIFALLGPNGAGKTTMVRILATLVHPDAGSASVAGFDVRTERRRVRREISLTGQDVALDELQTGEENLRMMAALSGFPGERARRRAAELLDRFGLHDARARRVATYSGGMRRRLDLAAGLVGNPAVIFLDEPTTGLDLPSRLAMWQVITELVQTGVTVFLTTQYLEEADQLADRIGVLDAGRLVAEGTSAELKRLVPGGHVRLQFGGADPLESAARTLDLPVADPAALALDVPGDGSLGQLKALLARLDDAAVEVAGLTVHTPDLDDVFLALTGRPAGTEVRPGSAGATSTGLRPGSAGSTSTESEPTHV